MILRLVSRLIYSYKKTTVKISDGLLYLLPKFFKRIEINSEVSSLSFLHFVCKTQIHSREKTINIAF